MKKIGYDQFKIDQSRIVEDSKCCLKVNAVISKAGVYLYDDGWALKPKMELLKASNAIRYAGAKLTLHKHPDSKVIMSQTQLAGGLEKPFFERDRIRATLNFDKALTPSPLLRNIRESVARKAGLDVSIGFYYDHDATPGFAADVNTGKQRAYDYVMRDILIDHVAVMFDGDLLRGRCTYPNCGIGVDGIMRSHDQTKIGNDKVVKRGEKWCVVHCHGEEEGEAIKCFPTKPEAEAMHRAIQAKKGSQRYEFTKNRKGVKTGMAQPLEEKEVLQEVSEFETLYPERSEAYRECVRQRMADGMTRGQAEAHCEPPTVPQDEPAPPPGREGTDQEAKTPTEECIAKKMEAGMTRKEAEEACKGETAGDEEAEKTLKERCVANQMDAGKTAEEAEEWCEAELAGEHEQADALIERSEKLLRMKEQRDIERQRHARRHPI